MNEYDDECLEVFLKNQSQLFDENVANTMDEAEEFLEDCMAVVCNSLNEVRKYFEEEGMDIEDEEFGGIEEAAEVFPLSNGRYLIVEA